MGVSEIFAIFARFSRFSQDFCKIFEIFARFSALKKRPKFFRNRSVTAFLCRPPRPRRRPQRMAAKSCDGRLRKNFGRRLNAENLAKISKILRKSCENLKKISEILRKSCEIFHPMMGSRYRGELNPLTHVDVDFLVAISEIFVRFSQDFRKIFARFS